MLSLLRLVTRPAEARLVRPRLGTELGRPRLGTELPDAVVAVIVSDLAKELLEER